MMISVCFSMFFPLFPHIHCGVLIFYAVARRRPRALPSRKHLGRAHARPKIALSLETSSTNRRFFYRFSIKNIRARAFKVLPRKTSSKFRVFPDFINIQKSRFRDVFNVLIMFVSSRIALSLETSSKFRRFIFIKIDQNCDHV